MTNSLKNITSSLSRFDKSKVPMEKTMEGMMQKDHEKKKPILITN
jgi:hypothetical protein